MEDLFSEGKVVRIETGGETVERYMRFLKVKDLPEFFSIDEIDDDVEKLAAFIELIERKTEGEIDSLASDAVFNAFINLNFGKAEPGEKKISGETDMTNNLASAFDFLISQGHSFSAITEYTVPRYRYLMEAACTRLFDKPEKPKKMDPLDAFRKLGFPIKHKTPPTGRAGNNK